MKIKNIETKFNIDDTVYEVYFDNDINAWNRFDWKIKSITIVKDKNNKGINILYSENEQANFLVLEQELFLNDFDAANEAKRRNQKNEK